MKVEGHPVALWPLVTSSQIFIGIGIIVGLALGCQVVAARLRIPSIILLLPAGFVAGALTSNVNPDRLLGPAFGPLVSLAVALVLFEGGLDLKIKELEGQHRLVTRRLIYLGVPITWAGGSLLAWGVLGLQPKTAVMLGAMLIVSGPTVIAPLLDLAKPPRRLHSILTWESVIVDPIGAIISVLVFEAILNGALLRPVLIVHFVGAVGLGLLGAGIGTAILWILLAKVKLSGVLATEATVATVIVVAAACDALHEDTGLVAAIGMGVALANMPIKSPEDRPFFKTIVQWVIGLLFVSISATVSPSSLEGLIGLTSAVVAGLVLVVRPMVAAAATARTRVRRNERLLIGMVDPRGIVAASTAASFAAPLVAAGIPGANKLLPVTFLVIVATVTVYGFALRPAVRWLGLDTAHHDPDPSTGEVTAGDPRYAEG